MLRRPFESAQYTSLAFGQRCREAGVRPSMGSVGDAYENAMAESFFATLGPKQKKDQAGAARILIQASASVDTANRHGMSALELSKLCGNRDMYEL